MTMTRRLPLLVGYGFRGEQNASRLAAREQTVRDLKRQLNEVTRLHDLALAQNAIDLAEADGTRIYEWLKTNDVDEPIPDDARIEADLDEGTLTYTAFLFHGPRGWDTWQADDGCDDSQFPVAWVGELELRTVPLRQPPDSGTVAAIERMAAGALSLSE